MGLYHISWKELCKISLQTSNGPLGSLKHRGAIQRDLPDILGGTNEEGFFFGLVANIPLAILTHEGYHFVSSPTGLVYVWCYTEILESLVGLSY